MDARHFPGMFSDADPHDLPAGASVTQTNFDCLVPGKLRVRKGVQVWPQAAQPISRGQLLSMFHYRPPGGSYLAMHTADGRVCLGNTVLSGDVLSAITPASFAQTRDGNMIFLNGHSRGQIYMYGDQVVDLGVDPATTAPGGSLTAGAGGAYEGKYYTAYRYLDKWGNPSNLSELAEWDASLNDAFKWSVTSATQDRLLLDGGTTEYYRSTADQATTLYLVGTGSVPSTDAYTDEQLVALTPLSILNPDGTLSARRFVPPPEGMSVVCQFQDRLFYAAPESIGFGEAWANSTSPSTMIIGAVLYTIAAGRRTVASYDDSVNPPVITFTGDGGTMLLPVAQATATVFPDSDIWNTILYSETDEFESVPDSQNKIIVQDNNEDTDIIVGLLPFNSVLWILKERHTYRLTFVKQPVIDAAVTMAFSRGAYNNRCWDVFEDQAFLMDAHGCWKLTASGYEPISGPIQNYWRDGLIDETRSRWFSVSVEPNEAVARFYLMLDEDVPVGTASTTYIYPTRAFCYSIRSGAWWMETYPVGLTGKARITKEGQQRLLMGGTNGAVEGSGVMLVGEGTGDRLNNAASTTQIDATFRSGKMAIPQDGQSERALVLDYPPLSGNASAVESALMRLYYDHETSPVTASQAWSGGPLSQAASSGDIDIDLRLERVSDNNASGYARYQFAKRAQRHVRGNRFVSVELVATQKDEAVAFSRLQIEGV